MEMTEYAALAISTAPRHLHREVQIVHAALGICGEAGEIADHVKKVTFNNKDLDKEHLVAEIGDVAWYLNLLISTLDTTWEHVFDVNIAKLSTRYPDLKYDHDKANNRDIAAEKAAMSAV